ncbi:hypothetical protein A2U01_0054545 [Trifolium medium]|uniref:Uncharacterized protein n=1 Tax=Trifolium medium TaxID=97028 RepID=A0A392R9K4_9FABA|nr:hypothetical protein [Trifolium medium]
MKSCTCKRRFRIFKTSFTIFKHRLMKMSSIWIDLNLFFDPNAAIDPNAAFDPNEVFDPNAPFDPNAS